MRQDTMSATWRKERSTVETNEIMKTAAHRSESWCWRQLHAADTCVKTQTSVLKEQHQCTSSLDDAMSTRRRHVRTRVWITNEARLRVLSHVLMLVLTQLVCGRPSVSSYAARESCFAVLSRTLHSVSPESESGNSQNVTTYSCLLSLNNDPTFRSVSPTRNNVAGTQESVRSAHHRNNFIVLFWGSSGLTDLPLPRKCVVRVHTRRVWGLASGLRMSKKL
jgi:hypothetical protein